MTSIWPWLQEALPYPIGNLPCDIHRRHCKVPQHSPDHGHGVASVRAAFSDPGSRASGQQYWEWPVGISLEHVVDPPLHPLSSCVLAPDMQHLVTV